MARIRFIKPEFFDDPEVAELSPYARLFFIGLWLQADRDGRLEDCPKRLKARIFPYDDVDVDALAGELRGKDMIRRFSSRQGKCYIWITNFLKHQRPHLKEPQSVIPPWEASLDTSTDPAGEKPGEPWKNPARTLDSGVLILESGVRSLDSGARGLEASPMPAAAAEQKAPAALKPRPQKYGRVTLHRWQLDELIDILGPNGVGFELDAWVMSLSQKADEQGLALARDEVWTWVQSELKAECQRRGIKTASSAKAPQLSKRTNQILAAVQAIQERGE